MGRGVRWKAADKTALVHRREICCTLSAECEGGRSGAVLSELFDEVAREPMQAEVSAVRVLFELLGFLLRQLSAVSRQLSAKSKTTSVR